VAETCRSAKKELCAVVGNKTCVKFGGN
jgi:hypothetical protein